MSVTDILSRTTELYAKAAENGIAYAGVDFEKAASISPNLALRLAGRFENIEKEHARKFMVDLGLAHKACAVPIMEALAKSSFDVALSGIAKIAKAHLEFVGDAIEILGENGTVCAAIQIGILARDYPEWTILAIDKLKVMDDFTSSVELSWIGRNNRGYENYAIEALKFKGDVASARMIIDIAESRLEYADTALSTVSDIRQGFEDCSNEAVRIDVAVKRLIRRLEHQVKPSPSI